MIKYFGKKKYILGGAYKKRQPAKELVEGLRRMNKLNKGVKELPRIFARLERCLDYSYNPPQVFYRVWQRTEPTSQRRKK